MPAGSRMPSHSDRASWRMRSRRCYRGGGVDRRGGEGKEVVDDGTFGRARSTRTCRHVWARSSCPSCSCAALRSSLRRRRRGIEVKESSRGMDRRFLHVDIDLREPTGTAPPPNKRGGGGLVLFCNALGHARVGPRGISSCVGAAKYRRWQYWREMLINSGRENKHGKLLPSFIHPSQLKSLIHLYKQ